MPKVEFVKKTIFQKEGLDVRFYKDGKDVRGDAMLPKNYISERMTKNTGNVTFLIEKLKKQFPGYDFVVFDAEGNRQHGNRMLANIRNTFVEEYE